MRVQVEEDRISGGGDLLVISLDLDELKTKSLEFRLKGRLLSCALGGSEVELRDGGRSFSELVLKLVDFDLVRRPKGDDLGLKLSVLVGDLDELGFGEGALFDLGGEGDLKKKTRSQRRVPEQAKRERSKLTS